MKTQSYWQEYLKMEHSKAIAEGNGSFWYNPTNQASLRLRIKSKDYIPLEHLEQFSTIKLQKSILPKHLVFLERCMDIPYIIVNNMTLVSYTGMQTTVIMLQDGDLDAWVNNTGEQI